MEKTKKLIESNKTVPQIIKESRGIAGDRELAEWMDVYRSLNSMTVVRAGQMDVKRTVKQYMLSRVMDLVPSRRGRTNHEGYLKDYITKNL